MEQIKEQSAIYSLVAWYLRDNKKKITHNEYGIFVTVSDRRGYVHVMEYARWHAL